MIILFDQQTEKPQVNKIIKVEVRPVTVKKVVNIKVNIKKPIIKNYVTFKKDEAVKNGDTMGYYVYTADGTRIIIKGHNIRNGRVLGTVLTPGCNYGRLVSAELYKTKAFTTRSAAQAYVTKRKKNYWY